MTDQMIIYPKLYRKNISRIVNATGAAVETAYAMMLMTATLMDLRPDDPKVAQIILDDCKGRRVIRKDECMDEVLQ